MPMRTWSRPYVTCWVIDGGDPCRPYFDACFAQGRPGFGGGTLANWDGSFPLMLANELTGDRPWLGEYCLVAIYDNALTPAEVTQNHQAGCPVARP